MNQTELLNSLSETMKPHFVPLIEKVFNKRFQESVAYGMGYKPTMTESIPEEITEETKEIIDGEEKISTTTRTEWRTEEKANPEVPTEFIAKKFIEILFAECTRAIELDYTRRVIPTEIGKAVKKLV